MRGEKKGLTAAPSLAYKNPANQSGIERTMKKRRADNPPPLKPAAGACAYYYYYYTYRRAGVRLLYDR